MRNPIRPAAAVLLACLALAAVAPLAAAPTTPATAYVALETRDPFMAAALSWFTPGLGQAYAGKGWRGLAWWGADNALFWGALFTICDLRLSLNGDVGVDFSIRIKKDPSSARVWTAVGLGLGWAVCRVWNVIDAADCAQERNRRLWEERKRGEGLSLSIEPDRALVAWSGSF